MLLIDGPSPREQIELLCGMPGDGKAEIAETLAGEHAAARRALQQALLDEVGLDHLLDDVALLGERGGQRLHADRAAIVVLGDAAQEATVHGIEALAVDIETPERRVGRGRVDAL